MDAIERIELATAEAQKAIDAITSDDMAKQTPCAEFDVKALLNHVIAGMAMLKTAATGGKATPPEGNIVGDDPAAQYRSAREELMGVLREPGVFDKTWEMPFGAMPGKMMAGIAFMEHLTHAWDIRKATGQPTELPEGIVSECMGLVQPMDAMLRMPGVCGPAVEVPDSASPTDKLVAFMGRQP
jgi:uncharacterized protein (TIGR03086 family)